MLKSGLAILALSGLTLAFPAENGSHVVIPEPRAGNCQFSHNFQSTGQQAYLRSPNWPNAYPNNADCKYSLTSPAGTKISMKCDEFNVEYTQSCTYDRMTISLSGDSSLRDGTVICGQGTFNRVSNANALTVAFKSDGSNPASQSLFRFQCVLTVEGTAVPQTTVPPTTQAPVPAAGGFSDQSCSCGTRNENTRIVGGDNAEVNEFPWRSAMYSPNFGVFCGSTIISPSWILTAAHCTNALGKNDVLYADVGDHDLTTTSESNNQIIKCDRVIQHAQYNNQTQDNDVALCHLEKPLTYSRTVS